MFNTDKVTSKYLIISIAAHIACASFVIFSVKNEKLISLRNVAIDFVIEPKGTESGKKTQQVTPRTSQNKKSVSQNIEKENDAVSDDVVAESNANDSRTTADSTSNAALGQQNGVAAKTPEQIYIAELKNFIDSKKKYPVLAKKRGHTGRVIVRFELNQDGSVISKKIITPSAHESLNTSTLNLIDRIGKFKRFPEIIKKTSWQFVVPVDYKL